MLMYMRAACKMTVDDKLHSLKKKKQPHIENKNDWQDQSVDRN